MRLAGVWRSSVGGCAHARDLTVINSSGTRDLTINFSGTRGLSINFSGTRDLTINFCATRGISEGVFAGTRGLKNFFWEHEVLPRFCSGTRGLQIFFEEHEILPWCTKRNTRS